MFQFLMTSSKWQKNFHFIIINLSSYILSLKKMNAEDVFKTLLIAINRNFLFGFLSF
jgi:hypothetical protein